MESTISELNKRIDKEKETIKYNIKNAIVFTIVIILSNVFYRLSDDLKASSEYESFMNLLNTFSILGTMTVILFIFSCTFNKKNIAVLKNDIAKIKMN